VLKECQWNLRGIGHRLWSLFHSNQATLRGHTSQVYSVAISPGGRRIVSSGDDARRR
jgi:WD40 repeat protein